MRAKKMVKSLYMVEANRKSGRGDHIVDGVTR